MFGNRGLAFVWERTERERHGERKSSFFVVTQFCGLACGIMEDKINMDRSEKKKYGYFNILGSMLKISVKNMPGTFFPAVLMMALAEVAAGAGVLVKQNLFDCARKVIDGGSVGRVYGAAILLGGYFIAAMLFVAAASLTEGQGRLRLQQEAGNLLHRKASKIDPICYEDNRFLDDIKRADRGVESAVHVMWGTISMAVMFLGYYGFMGAYLAQIETGLLVMLFLSFVPYIFGGAVRYRMHKRAARESAPYQRRGEYYGRCITDREYARETRLLGAYGYFFRKFRENMAMARDIDWKATKKSELVEIFLRFISMAGYIGMILLLFYYLMNGRVGIAAFAAILSSLDSMADKLDTMFRSRLPRLTDNIGSAENYMVFMNLPQRQAARELPQGKSVSFHNVSFAYPGCEEPALRQIDLEIRDGETVAIVGENGAGKSTFARLLLGIYCPTEGRVEIDDVDTRETDPGNSAGKLSAVFQNFQKYKMTLGENVFLSDSGHPVDEKRILQVLHRAGIDERSGEFGQGLDTMLSREFGGTDLSGGQWQRLAIARGLYRRHNLIVLDEPTASIDPLKETEIYQKFAESARNKTAVIITHRLGSARIADRIVVLDRGRIAEQGTHEELIGREGIYSRMYREQAKWYV